MNHDQPESHPIASMYMYLYLYIYHKNRANKGKYTMLGWYGQSKLWDIGCRLVITFVSLLGLIIPVSRCLVTMDHGDRKALSRVVPLPNGLFMAYT